MLNDNSILLLHPQQPWIFLPLVAFISVLVITSIIFLTPKRKTLLASTNLQRLRTGIAIILCIYLLFIILRNLLVFALVFLSVGGDLTVYKLPMFAGLGVVAILTILFWVKGSRIASILILISVSWSSYYLVNHRIQAICEPLARVGIARAQLCMADALADLYPGDGQYRTYTLTRENWAYKAALNGNVHAAYLVGVKRKDEELLRYAVRKAEFRAVQHLIKLLPSNSREKITLVEIAADNEDPFSMGKFGQMLIQGGEYGHDRSVTGLKIEEDFYKGFILVEKAANAGDCDSMWYLATRYAEGDYEFNKNDAKSKKWEKLAVAREQELIKHSNELKENPYNLEIRIDEKVIQRTRLYKQRELEKARNAK